MTMSFLDEFLTDGLAGASSIGSAAPTFNLGSSSANSLATNRYNQLIGQGYSSDQAGSLASSYALGNGSDGFQIEQNFVNSGVSTDALQNASGQTPLNSFTNGATSLGEWARSYFLGQATAAQQAGVANGTIPKTNLNALVANNGLTSGSWLGSRGAVVVVGLIILAGAMYLFGSGTLASSIVSGIGELKATK